MPWNQSPLSRPRLSTFTPCSGPRECLAGEACARSGVGSRKLGTLAQPGGLLLGRAGRRAFKLSRSFVNAEGQGGPGCDVKSVERYSNGSLRPKIAACPSWLGAWARARGVRWAPLRKATRPSSATAGRQAGRHLQGTCAETAAVRGLTERGRGGEERAGQASARTAGGREEKQAFGRNGEGKGKERKGKERGGGRGLGRRSM